VDLTGRRKEDIRRTLEHLQAAKLVESMFEFWALSGSFREEYERELRQSGIVTSERLQRYRHETDRKAREEELQRRRKGSRGGEAADPTPDTRGKDEVKRMVHRTPRERWESRVAHERAKAGMTPATFLEDEMSGAVAMPWREMRARWKQLGGRSIEALRLAVLDGPFEFKREPLDRDAMYVYHQRQEEEAV